MIIDEIYTLQNGILECDDIEDADTDFKIKLSLTFAIINPIITAIEKSRPKLPIRLEQYQNKHRNIVLKYSDNHKSENTSSNIVDTIKYKLEEDELKKEYATDIEKYNTDTQDWSVIFSKTVKDYLNKDIVFPILKMEELPKSIKLKTLRKLTLLFDSSIVTK